jgi:peptidoglycan-associated lipoprotein
MRGHVLKGFLLVGLLASAACAKKEELPPPPPPATPAPAPVADTGGSGVVGSAAIPGSRADFLEQVGSDTVNFGYDSYELDESAREILARQAAWLQKYPRVQLTIEGHADERGTREYNLALGERRATAVKNFLATAGVASSRISTISYGKERPLVEGSNEDAYAQNRRGVTVLSSGAAG